MRRRCALRYWRRFISCSYNSSRGLARSCLWLLQRRVVSGEELSRTKTPGAGERWGVEGGVGRAYAQRHTATTTLSTTTTTTTTTTIIIIIIIRNIYIASNPTRLAQSTPQFKTRMNIRSKHETCIHQRIQRQQQSAGKHAHPRVSWCFTPSQPVQLYYQGDTHPRTINAIKICNAAIHGPCCCTSVCCMLYTSVL